MSVHWESTVAAIIVTIATADTLVPVHLDITLLMSTFVLILRSVQIVMEDVLTIVKIPTEDTLAHVHLGINLLMGTTAVTSMNAPPVVIIVAFMQYAVTLRVDLCAVVNQAIWGMVLFVQVYLICTILFEK